MKFAENNRISHRQLYRQMILTFLAPFLICLPGKNGIQGMTGIAGALAAVILLVIYVFVLLRVTSGYSDMVRFFGRFWGRIAGLFFLAYIILTAVYILKILEQIVPRWLKPWVNRLFARTAAEIKIFTAILTQALAIVTAQNLSRQG